MGLVASLLSCSCRLPNSGPARGFLPHRRPPPPLLVCPDEEGAWFNYCPPRFLIPHAWFPESEACNMWLLLLRAVSLHWIIFYGCADFFVGHRFVFRVICNVVHGTGLSILTSIGVHSLNPKLLFDMGSFFSLNHCLSVLTLQASISCEHGRRSDPGWRSGGSYLSDDERDLYMGL